MAAYSGTCFALCISLAVGCVAQPRLTLLPVTTDPDLAPTWTIVSASLNENLVNTQGTLRLQNISGATQPETHFWADYLDAQDRICFTLAFSSPAVNPTNVLQLRSSAEGLSPVSEPVRVRVHRLPASVIRFIPEAPVRAPATIPEIGQQFKLPRSMESQQPIDDLLLARLRVEARGKPASVEILRSSHSEVTARLTVLLHEVIVQPSTSPAVQPDEILVLVRVVASGGLVMRTDPATLLPRRNPWVQEYMQTHPDSPPITALLYAAENLINTDQPHSISADTTEITYEQVVIGSFWSETVAGPKWDPESRSFVRTFSAPPQ